MADTLILNPIEFDQDEELRALVSQWLVGPDFAADPITATREQLFRRVTLQFTETHWRYLEFMVVLSGGTSNEVDEGRLIKAFEEMNLPESDQKIRKAGVDLHRKGLVVRGQYDAMRGVQPYYLSVPSIELVTEELRRQGRLWPVST